MSSLLVADRSERGKLGVTGEQRAWFLHQVLTQEFENITPGEARDSALLTPHGRMVAYLEAIATHDAILCHFEPELTSILAETLEKYVFATRVEIADVTHDFGLVFVVGEGWDAAADARVLAKHPTRSVGELAGYLWTRRADAPNLVRDLEHDGAVVASEEELETIRIGNGVARWGRDMDAKTFPQEAGIDEHAIHFDKGCYLGQEAMAKIHFRGKVNRRLRRLHADDRLRAGEDVFIDGQKVGNVTSVANGRALAMLRYTVEPGSVVKAGDVSATVLA